MTLKLTKLTQPASQPVSSFARAVMTKDGQYLLSTTVTSAYRSFLRTGVTWAQVNSVGSFTALKGNSIQGFALSPDETKIAWGSNVTGSQSNFIATWDKVAGTLTLDTLDAFTTSATYSVAWHPSGNYVAIGAGLGGTGPASVVMVYKKTGPTTWSTVQSITVGSANIGLAWNIAGTILIVGNTVAPLLRAYDWASETLTLRGTAAVDTQPATNSVRSIAVNPIDDSFVVVRNATPGYNFYKWNSGTGQGNIVASSESAGTQGVYGSNAAWTSDGKHFTVPLAITPWFYIYDYDLTTKTYALASDQLPQTDIAAATFGGAFAQEPNPWMAIPSAVSTLNIFYYADKFSTTSFDLNGLLPTSAAVVGAPHYETIQMSGFLPTTAAAAKQSYPATIAVSGFLPTSAAAVKQINKATAPMSGFLPTTAASAKYALVTTSVAVTPKFTATATTKETWKATSVSVTHGFTMAATGQIIDPATSVGVTKPFTAAGVVSVFATMSAVLVTPAFTAEATGSFGNLGSGALVTPKFVAAGTVEVTLTASSVVTTRPFTAVATGNVEVEVRVDGMMPKFWADAHAVSVPGADATGTLVTKAFVAAAQVKLRNRRRMIRVY